MHISTKLYRNSCERPAVAVPRAFTRLTRSLTLHQCSHNVVHSIGISIVFPTHSLSANEPMSQTTKCLNKFDTIYLITGNWNFQLNL